MINWPQRGLRTGKRRPRWLRETMGSGNENAVLTTKSKPPYSKLAFPSPKWLLSTAAWEKRLKTRNCGGLSTNWEADIGWRIADGIVKTRAYLHRWQPLCESERCVVCGEIESCSYIFCECTLASAVWAWVFSLVYQLYSFSLGFRL